MTKTIGILGGISPASTAQYYRTIIDLYYQRKQDSYYPEIVIYSLNFQRFTDFENAQDTEGYIAEILKGIQALERAGADFVLMAANSPHAVYPQLVEESRLPLLSIVEVTAQKAQELGLKRLLLLGIAFTMESGFYQGTFQCRNMTVIPPNSDHRRAVNAIIFDELVVNQFREATRKRLLGIIDHYDIDGVILGCTELPLILKQADTATVLLDTLYLHASAALDYALESG
jgi:aspartate racemase